MRLKHGVKINRPVEEVFQFLSNAENCPKWVPSVDNLIVTSQNPIGVGTTGLVRGRLLGWRVQFTFACDTYDAPYQLAGHTMSGRPDVRVSSTLQSVKDGTLVRSSLDVTLGGVMNVAAPLMVIMVKWLLWRGFSRFRSILETAAGEQPG